MIRVPAMAARRLAAMLVVLSALFHVQWLAACEYMPMGGEEKSCCAGKATETAPHCGKQTGPQECVTPFATGTAGAKAPDRLSTDDDTPDGPLAAVAPVSWRLPARNTPPPAWRRAELADGRTLYLSSGRLRL